MELPSYLTGIINHSYKHKEIESIKRQIQKLIPDSFTTQSKTILSNTQASTFRKTVSTFHMASIDPLCSLPYTKSQTAGTTHQLQRKLSHNKEQVWKGHVLSCKKEESEDAEEGERIKEWKQEMLRHFRPRKQVQIPKDQQISEVPQYKLKKREKIEGKEMKIFKVRMSSPSFRSKFKSTIQNQKKSPSQKNFILIRPVVEQEDVPPLKQKSTTKIKAILSDKYPVKPTTQWNELAMQRIANFKALLPYLGTQKVKVESKVQKKQALGKYEPEESLKQQRNEKSLRKQREKVLNEQISGWQIQD